MRAEYVRAHRLDLTAKPEDDERVEPGLLPQSRYAYSSSLEFLGQSAFLVEADHRWGERTSGREAGKAGDDAFRTARFKCPDNVGDLHDAGPVCLRSELLLRTVLPEHDCFSLCGTFL